MSETHPPEGDPGHGEPLPLAEKPPTRNKRKLDWPFAVLGFFTPWVATLAIGLGFNAATDALSNHPRIMGYGPGAVEVAVFAGLLVAFVMGRRNGDNRLRSFGLGGLICYVAAVLLGLLVFGACFVILSGPGLFGK
jgi:hypothetical protein